MTKTLFRNSVFALVALAIPSLVGVGDALAIDSLLIQGGIPLKPKLPAIPPGLAACAGEIETLAAPSKEEAKLAEEVKQDELSLESARNLLALATTGYKKLGCDLEKGVWPNACGKAAKALAENRKRVNDWQQWLTNDRHRLKDMTSARVAQLQQKLIKLNGMCPGGKLGTGTANSDGKGGDGDSDDTSAAAGSDNTEGVFAEPTDDDNSGVSEPTDQDNTAATEPDDTQEATGEDDSGASEATDDNSAAADTDPDAELVATCAANPNCQMLSPSTGNDDNSAAAEPDSTQEPADEDTCGLVRIGACAP